MFCSQNCYIHLGWLSLEDVCAQKMSTFDCRFPHEVFISVIVVVAVVVALRDCEKKMARVSE